MMEIAETARVFPIGHESVGVENPQGVTVLPEREFLEDFTVIDLVLSRSFAYGRSLLRVSNLTDERYQAVRGVPQPGRWVSLETQIGL